MGRMTCRIVCYIRPGGEQNEERKGGVHVLGEHVSRQVQSLTLKSVAFEEQQVSHCAWGTVNRMRLEGEARARPKVKLWALF